MAQDYSATQAHNLFFHIRHKVFPLVILPPTWVKLMCHLNVHFEQNPFSCQHEQEEKPIQDQAVSWELNGLTHQQQPSPKKSLCS